MESNKLFNDVMEQVMGIRDSGGRLNFDVFFRILDLHRVGRMEQVDCFEKALVVEEIFLADLERHIESEREKT